MKDEYFSTEEERYYRRLDWFCSGDYGRTIDELTDDVDARWIVHILRGTIYKCEDEI